MLTHKLQQDVMLGTPVTVILTTGDRMSGKLIEIAVAHITLRTEVGTATIVTANIAAWQTLGAPQVDSAGVQSAPSVTPTYSDLSEVESVDHARPSADEGPAVAEAIAASPAAPAPTLQPEDSLVGDKTHAQVVSLDLLRKTIEIEARLQGRSSAATLTIDAPNFLFPEGEVARERHPEARRVWERLANSFEYASRVNELGIAYGRVKPLVGGFESLTDQYDSSPSMHRHLAYLHYLTGDLSAALDGYLDAANIGGTPHDWLNAAVVAVDVERPHLACYSLQRYFELQQPSASLPAWYVFLGLMRSHGLSAALLAVWRAHNSTLPIADQTHIVEGALFLLPESAREVAVAIVRQENGVPTFLDALTLASGALAVPLPTAYQEARDFATEPQPTPNISYTNPAVGNDPSQQRGTIKFYKIDKGYGFLKADASGIDHFFHKSAVADDDILELLESDSDALINVGFEAAGGPRGPIAIRVSLVRSAEERHALAEKLLREGEYAKAAEQLKQVLLTRPDYPGVVEQLERVREYARAATVPKGSGYYARAKRAQVVEKQPERAIVLFKKAIEMGENIESSIKDLAMLLVQMERAPEAVQVIERNLSRIRERQSMDNLLIATVYPKAGQYGKAIALLEGKHRSATTPTKSAQIAAQLANLYMQSGDYIRAEEGFREVASRGFDTRSTQRSIAYCLVKQEKYGDAETILNGILGTAFDAQSAELLQAITRARATGDASRLDDIVESNLVSFSGELSGFARYYLERCQFEGVDPAHVQAKSFDRGDVRELDRQTEGSATRNPRGRAELFLSAAKILAEIDDWGEPDEFYRYLGRSFTSRGDATVAVGGHTDAIREWYGQALAAYDGVRMDKGDDQSAANALVRYLFSLLGSAQVPITTKHSVDDALNKVSGALQSQRKKAFDAIASVCRSRTAATRLLNPLFVKSSLRAMSLDYLASMGISVHTGSTTQEGFVRLWNELLVKQSAELRDLATDLRVIAKVELSAPSLENAIRELQKVERRQLCDLDQQRIQQLRQLLEKALDLCDRTSFDDRYRLCEQVEARCQDFINDTVASPTRLSVETLRSVVERMHELVKHRQQEIYDSSLPQLSLSMLVDRYLPSDRGAINVQFEVSNKHECSPADSVTIVLADPDSKYFSLDDPDMRIAGALRGGGDPGTKFVPLQLTAQALESQAFSLSAYAQYRTLAGDVRHTPIVDFSIRLTSDGDFQPFDNHYKEFAFTGEVDKKRMFYGRDEFIDQMATAICSDNSAGRCYLIYGQKRVGKSSVRLHLRRRLEQDPNLLPLDLGNIGPILTNTSSAPVLHKLLWRILDGLPGVIGRRIASGAPSIDFIIPTDTEFFGHPDPLWLFDKCFETLRQKAAETPGWERTRVLLLLDEFGYIFEHIVKSTLPSDFMKVWKALLQRRLFNAVLVGSDVMPKFKALYANEFGTTQDVRVTYLKREDAMRLVEEPMHGWGAFGHSRFAERRAVDRILELTACSPFYIQIFCDLLVDYMHEIQQPQVTYADVERVKEKLIKGIGALAEDKFENLFDSGDTSPDKISADDTKAVLSAIALNSRSGPCSRSSIAVETKTPLDDVLVDLEEREVIHRHDGQYYGVQVKLYEEWLVAHPTTH
jgi:tetratricopeptide (TPR) repeat protein